MFSYQVDVEFASVSLYKREYHKWSSIKCILIQLCDLCQVRGLPTKFPEEGVQIVAVQGPLVCCEIASAEHLST